MNRLCEMWYISLVLIFHRYEQAFLTSVIGFNPVKYFWIGLSDAEEQGTFRWASGDAVTFTHWNTGMPGMCHGSSRLSVLGTQKVKAESCIRNSSGIKRQKQQCSFLFVLKGWNQGLWLLLPVDHLGMHVSVGVICSSLFDGFDKWFIL